MTKPDPMAEDSLDKILAPLSHGLTYREVVSDCCNIPLVIKDGNRWECRKCHKRTPNEKGWHIKVTDSKIIKAKAAISAYTTNKEQEAYQKGYDDGQKSQKV